MKILIASTPGTGHVNPMLAVARMLMTEGHDVAIYTNSSATTTLFKGAVVTGPTTTTYHVPALKAGTYYFRCDIHPTQMTGTFVVG